MLKGQKVLLRPVRRSDIQYFLKWFNDAEVVQYVDQCMPMTEMAAEKWIERMGTEQTQVYFVIEAVGGETTGPIGGVELVNINPKDHNAMFSIAIGDKDSWSKGYGTEAGRLIIKYGFEQLNLHRIGSEVLAFNERSLRMHRSIGFKEEGRRRESCFGNGQYQDEVVFGILRGEWKGL
ncbi:MAG: GNAT family N-acetyltransferase [Chloroflexi bacterium]|nr:GNAT family N-acetyltransferase [Chloroflexota bacterium]